MTHYSPIALQVKQIIDGTYFAYKRGRRFRIKEHEIVDILAAITELENKGEVAQKQVEHTTDKGIMQVQVPPPPSKILKKGEPGYEEWLKSLPTSKKTPLDKE